MHPMHPMGRQTCGRSGVHRMLWCVYGPAYAPKSSWAQPMGLLGTPISCAKRKVDGPCRALGQTSLLLALEPLFLSATHRTAPRAPLAEHDHRRGRASSADLRGGLSTTRTPERLPNEDSRCVFACRDCRPLPSSTCSILCATIGCIPADRRRFLAPTDPNLEIQTAQS